MIRRTFNGYEGTHILEHLRALYGHKIAQYGDKEILYAIYHVRYDSSYEALPHLFAWYDEDLFRTLEENAK